MASLDGRNLPKEMAEARHDLMWLFDLLGSQDSLCHIRLYT